MKRREFIKGAGIAAAATTVASVEVKAQAPQFRWKMQSANPAGTPHMTLLNNFASNVNKMSGGRLQIEVLTSGAIVKPFEILDAVNKGVIDSGQWWTHYATGKHPAGGLFSAPLGGSGSGLDQMGQLGWYMRGGGRELYVEYYQKMLRADVMPFLYAPDGPECFGWFKKPITSVAEFTKLRFRISSGLPSDVLKDMGGVPMNLPGQELIPAAERGIIDGVEWINPANDLPLGLHDVFKFYSIQGLHQAIDIADVMFNGAKWRSLPPDLQAIVETALTTSLFDAMLYFAHENAKALKEIKAKGVTIFDAPADYAPAFIKSAKKVLANLEAKDPFFKKVLESQRDLRERRRAVHARDVEALDADQRRGRDELIFPRLPGSVGAPGHAGSACLRRPRSRRRGVRGGLMQRRVPGVVAVEPARVGVAFLHPGIGAGDRLHHRGARLAVRLVAPERALDVVALDRLEAARQHGRILDRGRGALRHVGRHRMSTRRRAARRGRRSSAAAARARGSPICGSRGRRRAPRARRRGSPS